ncbi:response regulator [Dyadobacter sp. Leaf189]|uniref:response regulator n=1 Tax=Dyadobacter sp. Leaf189 TaxID=1736295 RepID=UPI0006F4A653|nr:response regulator [Dyadobacter sp. Leaf189]KQS27880.1 hypothetical protein ASG33_15820 [Dyadobacter sp. Leaf189]
MKLYSQFIVVDDDPVNNMVSKYMIANVAPGARIQLFDDPDQALASIKNEFNADSDYPDTVLFLDINMPTMSGWEFLDQISLFPAELTARISIFILSSSIDPKDKKSAESHPLVSGYFSKPLNREMLKALLGG